MTAPHAPRRRPRPHAAAWGWLRGLHPAAQVAVVLAAAGLVGLMIWRGELAALAGLLPMVTP